MERSFEVISDRFNVDKICTFITNSLSKENTTADIEGDKK
jgi:hypothetical protein